jgi:hypothetical protein
LSSNTVQDTFSNYRLTQRVSLSYVLPIEAIADGFMEQQANTRRIVAESAFHTIEGTVSADADFGEVFTVTEDDGTKLRLNGWLFDVEVVSA